MNELVTTLAGFDLYTAHNNLRSFCLIHCRPCPAFCKRLCARFFDGQFNSACTSLHAFTSVDSKRLGRCTGQLVYKADRSTHLAYSGATVVFFWRLLMAERFSHCCVVQSETASNHPVNFRFVDNIWKNPNGTIWIPDSVSDLQLRLCIIAQSVRASSLVARCQRPSYVPIIFSQRWPVKSSSLYVRAYTAFQRLKREGYRVLSDLPHIVRSRMTSCNLTTTSSDRVAMARSTYFSYAMTTPTTVGCSYSWTR